MHDMLDIVLHDSWLAPRAPICGCARTQTACVMQAVRLLNDEIEANRISCCTFGNTRREEKLPSLVECFAAKSEPYGKGSGSIVRELSFTTSHYVGQACVDACGMQVRIRILPHIAAPLWNYLLGSANRVYLPERLKTEGIDANNLDSTWLLLLMWRNSFERAMKMVSVPKTYVNRNENIKCFKGRLDVPRHLKQNIADQSRFHCIYRPLTFDNTINRTIRCVYRVLANSQLSSKTYLAIAEHDARLASFGVKNTTVTTREIDSIQYTRITEPYRPVMQLSKVILQGYGAGEYEGGGKGPSFFIDIAEIWENYLLSVFKRTLPQYTFVSPNDENSGEWLLDNSRKLRPDFLVYDKGGNLLAVMDAKFKRYDRIGKFSNEPNVVSREDLYQMGTYLYRYADPQRRFGGIFISPFGVSKEDYLNAVGNKKHFMAVCNLPLGSIENDDKVSLKEVRRILTALETDFSARLNALLKHCVYQL